MTKPSAAITKLMRDIGVTKSQFSDWLAMAQIPEAEFEEKLASPVAMTTLAFEHFYASHEIPPRRGRGKSADSLRLIAAAHEILSEIRPATVRAVCYRLFAMGLIDNMSKGNTNKVSTHLVGARKDGTIPWNWVVDETREAERVAQWNKVEEFAETVWRCYRKDRWANNPRQVEVWSEKGTVRGTLSPILNEYGVTFRVMHGYASATAVKDVAEYSADLNDPLLVFYIGDYDPSGMHMSEIDLPGRLNEYGGRVEIVRVALTEKHLDGLPSFNAETKTGDPRHRWFCQNYGRVCWELDALSPVTLRDEVASWIKGQVDEEYWERCEVVERAERESLKTVMDQWMRMTP